MEYAYFGVRHSLPYKDNT